MFDGEPFDQLRPGKRCRPQHHPLGPGGERLGDRLGVAQPAPELNRGADFGRDPPHVLEVLGLAGTRPVEVDDVQEARPLLDPAPRGVHRVGVVHGLAAILATLQANGVPTADVDRRERDTQAGTEAQISVKFASRRRPAALDFSGWNWTP